MLTVTISLTIAIIVTIATTTNTTDAATIITKLHRVASDAKSRVAAKHQREAARSVPSTAIPGATGTVPEISPAEKELAGRRHKMVPPG